MSREDTLAAGRVAAEQGMTSRAKVRRRTGDTVKVDGYDVDEWQIVYADLPFRLAATGTGDGGTRRVSIGGVEFQDATARGDMPASTTDLADDDLIEVMSGEWAGSVWRIVEAVKVDQRTARRAPIVEAARPEEWL